MRHGSLAPPFLALPAIALLLAGCGSTHGELFRGIDASSSSADASIADASSFECSTKVLGDNATCHDLELFQQQAQNDCSSKGQILNSTTYSELCSNTGVYYFKYRCCPTNLADGCTVETQSDGTSCLSIAAWESSASQACALEGKSLTSLSVETECATSTYASVKYVCCP